MDELTIGDKTYISSKRAAKITGYAKDYIGQLCREGRVEARLVGRNWYVLETSITEHRFGISDKDKKVTEVQPISPRESVDPVVAWSAPSYEPEVPSFVPPLTPKDPETLVSRRVVSEMQTAWQEWFSQQKEPELLLEESLEDFDGSNVPVVVGNEEEEGEVVHLFRMEPVEEKITDEEQPVQVNHYDYGERLVAAAEVMDLSIRTAVQTPERGTQQSAAYPYEPDEDVYSAKSSVLVKAVLIGVAFIALCVALVGTGTVGDLVLQTQGKDSVQSKIIKYLGGESEYDNSK